MKPEETGGTNIKVERVEHWVTLLLRVGVMASIVVIALGMLLCALHHPKLLYSPDELGRLFAPGGAYPKAFSQLAHGLAAFQGQAVMTCGLLILLLLPAMRVALAGLVFLYQRDRIFVVITCGVLLLLALSLVLGAAG